MLKLLVEICAPDVSVCFYGEVTRTFVGAIAQDLSPVVLVTIEVVSFGNRAPAVFILEAARPPVFTELDQSPVITFLVMAE